MRYRSHRFQLYKVSCFLIGCEERIQLMSRAIEQMRNLGPRCAGWLADIGIHDENDLRAVGAAVAYRELIIRGVVRPHRMLLYALGGALLDIDCNRLSREMKRTLEEEATLDC